VRESPSYSKVSAKSGGGSALKPFSGHSTNSKQPFA
jgi:hypothetical protein